MKHRVALNRLFGLYLFLGLVLIGLGISSWLWQETALAIGFFLFGLLVLVASVVLVPLFYRFDRDGVTICYIFFPNERYLWKNVRSIEARWKSTTKGGPLSDWLFSRVFYIAGRPEGKYRRYMTGEITRTGRTKRLLQTHWDEEIAGLKNHR